MTWKKQLQDNITSAAQLREFRQLSEEEERRMDAILHKYPMRVTRYYLSLVDWDNYEEDPIYRLCVPTIREDDLSGSLDTGGDSFLLSNDAIRHYLELLAPIPSLHFIRFGTRTPVTFPMRITEDPELIEILREYNRKKQIFVITHFNHPREITEQSIQAVRLLREAGIVVRNQTVLMRSINDDPQVLAQLMQKLISIGVVPYYIFQCRPVTGVGSQFQVPLREGWRIVETTRGMINGQAKSFKFAMSHVTGKIEIIGPSKDGRMIFRYNQAKSPDDLGRIFLKRNQRILVFLNMS